MSHTHTHTHEKCKKKKSQNLIPSLALHWWKSLRGEIESGPAEPQRASVSLVDAHIPVRACMCALKVCVYVCEHEYFVCARVKIKARVLCVFVSTPASL